MTGGRFRWFREEDCDRCGTCFVRCPVLALDEADARREIAALIDGDLAGSRVLRACTTCGACDASCPSRADPYELVLERFADLVRERGLSPLARLVLPDQPGNLWGAGRTLLDDDERGLLDAWAANLDGEHEEILLVGFYANLVPHLLRADCLRDLAPVMAGSEATWGCGADAHKMGLHEEAARAGRLVHGLFARMGVRRVVCAMQSEAALLAEVLPARYGIAPAFEVRSLDEWLLSRLSDGSLRPAPLGLRVAVHDHCHARHGGGRPQEVLREVARRCGCEPVEMEHCRGEALCCGWAATIPAVCGPDSGSAVGTLLQLLSALERRYAEARATGAEILLVSCPACYLFLTLIATLLQGEVRVVHLVELVDSATGGTRPQTSGMTSGERRAWDVLSVSTDLLLKQAGSRARRRRFWPVPFDPDRPEPAVGPGSSDLRRLRAVASVLGGPFVQNAVSRTLLHLSTRAAIRAWRARVGRR